MAGDGEPHDFEESVEPGEDDEPLDADEVRLVGRITALNTAARVLRAVAVVAGLAWAFGVVAYAWTAWDTYAAQKDVSFAWGQAFSPGSEVFAVIRQAAAVTATQTWPYLAVAVAAYVSSVLMAVRYEETIREI